MDLRRSEQRRALRTPGVVAALIAVGLAASGCAASALALGTDTARVSINGTEVAERPLVSCRQEGFTWLIDSVSTSPGFAAQVQTGADVKPLLVRLTDLGGFTGNFTDGNLGKAEARIVDGSIVVSGTADGTYGDTSTKQGTADFEIRTEC